MYPYAASSSIFRCRATAHSFSAAFSASSSSSLISLFATKPISLMRCYGGLGQLSGALRSEEVKSFSTDSPRVLQGCIGGHHSSQSFARGGFARTSGLSSAAMDVKNNVSAPYALCFRSFIYSASGRNFEPGRGSKSMNFVRGIIEEDGKDLMDFRGGSQLSRYTLEQNADIVHLKLLRNNTFVTVTDSKGNTKCKASAGCLPELKGGAKMSRYAAEATSEHVGRMSRNMGLKSVVMKVKGFTYFKKKRQAIMSWREGFTNSRGVQNPIVYIEDTTRRPHNGCRLPKRRRI
ncbi:probable ribosomal protein S11, mitochondrial [Carya illinoinensis]|uniref:Ribosomal protein S11 n=1 Tax=Carya illinoinensis TaxID=32201 RepID=A0A8T1QKE6_CARIL|nr:probable ribosomal protein S11, mitochondrial [Carya illinoinensis]XP_042979126.1 probable ribosomal protein S11, mitochondrial [Carya illinoinensis]XP_042979127.1 probable ribosomal protein S11, mitochondrial [Carya illinoinensis]XP_042979128.1 probable ribosomal protein S11, mitochondrial [Carya illinoinensis]XP_042979129.1 probable ribosomal protein S11, mitochondrial [Carya illinoinensis]XP_042979130.1 probable ribosomal protein S11, mitochondrial [Carya illinoinensis]KAG6655175.1 hypo